MRERIPRDDVLEQKIAGDPQATAEYVTSARREFEGCLRKIFLEIAKKAFNKETDIAESMLEKGLECHRNYFQTMKGGINLTQDDINTAIVKEEERQNKFYNTLRSMSKEFKKPDVKFEIMPPDECYKDPAWDTGLVAGCNIRTNGAYLCAFPLVPATTSCYMALVQEPVATQVVFINEDCIILTPHDQVHGKDFWKAGEKFFHKMKDIKDDFPGAYSAKVGNNFLYLDTHEAFSDHQLKELTRKYCVNAIVKGNSGNFTGFIYTGREGELPALLKDVFFQWHKNWEIYGL